MLAARCAPKRTVRGRLGTREGKHESDFSINTTIRTCNWLTDPPLFVLVPAVVAFMVPGDKRAHVLHLPPSPTVYHRSCTLLTFASVYRLFASMRPGSPHVRALKGRARFSHTRSFAKSCCSNIADGLITALTIDAFASVLSFPNNHQGRLRLHYNTH